MQTRCMMTPKAIPRPEPKGADVLSWSGQGCDTRRIGILLKRVPQKRAQKVAQKQGV